VLLKYDTDNYSKNYNNRILFNDIIDVENQCMIFNLIIEIILLIERSAEQNVMMQPRIYQFVTGSGEQILTHEETCPDVQTV